MSRKACISARRGDTRDQIRPNRRGSQAAGNGSASRPRRSICAVGRTGQDGDTQVPAYHDRDGLDRVQLEAFARRDARAPQVVFDMASAPVVALIADERFGGQQAVRMPARVARSRRQHIGFLSQQLPAQALGQRVGRLQRDRGIQFAAFNRRIEARGVSGLDFHADQRVAPDQVFQDGRHHGVQRRAAGAQPKLAHHFIGPRQIADLLDVFQDLAHRSDQFDGLGGQVHRAPGARHQRHPQVLFQLAHLLRHGAVREPEAAGGLGHGAVLGDGGQRAQKVGVHDDRYSIFLSYSGCPLM